MLHAGGGSGTRAWRWRLPARRRQAWISLALVAFLAPHLWVVAAGEERFPLTSAAMFAYPVDEGTPRYAMHLTAELPAGRGEPGGAVSHAHIDFGAGGAHPRHLFSYTWGSASPASYHTHHPDDGPDAFAARLGAWLGGFHRTLQARHPDEVPPRALTLWLQPVHPQLLTPRAIARFDATTGTVTLHPGQTWPGEDEAP